jgi:hypothetical protein
MLPVAEPVAAGVNVTLMVQVPPPGDIVPTQLLVCLKSVLPMVIPEIVNVDVPSFTTVMVWALLVTLTG